MCAVDRIQIAGDKPFLEAFGLDRPPIAPLDLTNYPMWERPVVRNTLDGDRELVAMHWGLVPFWAKEKKIGRNAFNARIESLIERKPMFRSAFQQRRCLLIGTSYIEHRWESGRAHPYEFTVDGGEPYAYAGLWERWDNNGQPYLSCTMVTTKPNEIASDYHDRMPAILDSSDYDAWLDPGTSEHELVSLLVPFPSERMQVRPTVIDRDTKQPVFKF